MIAGKAIHSILKNDATVGPLVLEDTFYKIFPLQIKQRYGYPAIVYTPVSNVPNETKTSASRFDQTRYQVDCYGETYNEVATLAQAVRAALDRYNDSQPVTIEGVVVKGISFLNFNGTLDESDNIIRMSADYQIIVDPFPS